MNRRRVVITGLGLVTPLGNSVEESWNNILAGKSGISTITNFDASTFPVRFSGSIKNFELDSYIPKKEQKKMSAFIHYGMAAGIQAVEDAGIDVNDINPHRVGAAIGSGIGGISGIEKGTESILNSGPRKISPFYVPSNIINMISGNLSIRYGFKGPNFCIVTACATGTHNIGDAARVIEYGDADVMVAGGAENASSPTSLAGFANAKALSTRNDEPEKASRPWDRDRDGFVLSDGAGAIVLEEYEHARSRGANVYAEIIGYGMSGDAYHMTAPQKMAKVRYDVWRMHSITHASTKQELTISMPTALRHWPVMLSKVMQSNTLLANMQSNWLSVPRNPCVATCLELPAAWKPYSAPWPCAIR